jgi:hypothetical protein
MQLFYCCIFKILFYLQMEKITAVTQVGEVVYELKGWN